MRTPSVSWAEMVKNPAQGGMRILANQIEYRNDFIRERGLWDEFQKWLAQSLSPRSDE